MPDWPIPGISTGGHTSPSGAPDVHMSPETQVGAPAEESTEEEGLGLNPAASLPSYVPMAGSRTSLRLSFPPLKSWG